MGTALDILAWLALVAVMVPAFRQLYRALKRGQSGPVVIVICMAIPAAIVTWALWQLASGSGCS